MKLKMLCYSLLASAALAAAEGPNLLKNPDFKDPAGYRKNWQFISMGDEIFDVRYDKEKSAVSIASCSNEFSGYLCQMVDVKPGKRYICRARTLLPRGRILLYAIGHKASGEATGTEGRIWDYSYADNPLFPEFIPFEYSPGKGNTDWKNISFVLDVPKDIVRYQVKVGSYFGEGILYVRLVEFREILK
ncbi:MAG: hypothetical protein IKC82_01090 [Lentisphaeria bacterium]|nr:hypothetical protein [Lentisphaeria bacterium]